MKPVAKVNIRRANRGDPSRTRRVHHEPNVLLVDLPDHLKGLCEMALANIGVEPSYATAADCLPQAALMRPFALIRVETTADSEIGKATGAAAVAVGAEIISLPPSGLPVNELCETLELLRDC